MKSIQKLLFGIAIVLFGISTILACLGSRSGSFFGNSQLIMIGWIISAVGMGVAASGFWPKKNDQKE